MAAGRLRVLSRVPSESGQRRVTCHFSATSRPTTRPPGSRRPRPAGWHTPRAPPRRAFSPPTCRSPSTCCWARLGRALGFVVGSSIYHIGLQLGRWSQYQELQVLTRAMNNARELAMTRMQAEADHLGADGIVGVELRMQSYVWGQDVLEFIATGTAVRALGSARAARRAPTARRTAGCSPGPVGSGLLPAAGGGSLPCLLLGTCVYHIAHQSAMQSLRQAGQHQEMVGFAPRASTTPANSRSPGCRPRQRRARTPGIVGRASRQQSQLGPTLKISSPRNRHPAPRRRAPAPRDLAQAHLHPGARRLAAFGCARRLRRGGLRGHAGAQSRGAGPVGYASDRLPGLSATPSTSSIGVGGVADRWRFGRWRRRQESSGSLRRRPPPRSPDPRSGGRASTHPHHAHHSSTGTKVSVGLSGRGVPPPAHDDARGRKTRPPTAHDRRPRPRRVVGILHRCPKTRTGHRGDTA